MNNDEDNDVNLNGIDSHGSEAEPGVDAVEMRDWVRLPVFVLPLLIMIMMIMMMIMMIIIIMMIIMMTMLLPATPLLCASDTNLGDQFP